MNVWLAALLGFAGAILVVVGVLAWLIIKSAQRRPDAFQEQPPRFECEICEEHFDRGADAKQHAIEEHVAIDETTWQDIIRGAG